MPLQNLNDTQLYRPVFRNDVVLLLRDMGEPVPWKGRTAISWARSFSPKVADRLASAGHAELGQHLSRRQLHAFCARKDVLLEFRVAAVMAWGRSNPRNHQHNRNLWASISNIAPLLNRLPELNRRQAFAEFRRLIASGSLRGMRASFFTKLMFFFGCSGAYILDQWMAKAVLALLAANWQEDTNGEPMFVLAPGNFIRLGPGGKSIHLSMSDDGYETYCATLESLIGPLGRSDGGEVERWLFSAPKSAWRQYLEKLEWNPVLMKSHAAKQKQERSDMA